ncbi:MAG TPA: zinc-binding dehydrogenase [Stackebrandtia sp.]|uniref:quinone oxidoreductase family protein n=1 Tax=Stackebrandtia sp. TaxID=2023065 RepID=UPI002D4C02B8|nr:zinc-binding dehydrogenase [Stackebrandtia sp.]HZE40095.1 zinc-binding dehydrogenase [Stackebrandtia sp.]
MRAIQFDRFGGPEVLDLVERDDPAADGDRLLLDVTAAGVNFADIEQVSGEYAKPKALPHIPGSEVVGRTADGRRVAALTSGGGGYASRAAVHAHLAVDVPDGVDDGSALAVLVQGLTAWHMLASAARLAPAETVVVHAAAGGVGSLAVQLARGLGAGRVIAVASTQDKRRLAVELGADVAVSDEADDYPARIRAANDGLGADVILDANGGALQEIAAKALAPLGRLVSYGNASGEPRPLFNPDDLAENNAALIGFWIRPLLDLPGYLEEPLGRMFAMVGDQTLRPLVSSEYALDNARQAHQDMKDRRTTGKVWLRV